ncbi:MAG: TlpA family protein disulfide reductase [Thermoflavifilum sp.]|nr:TlpA family protein disulfide reductase [Thermoflavifilum sp.]
MKKIFLLFLLSAFVFSVHAQHIEQLNTSQLKSFTQKHDGVYVINLWATWCRPCVDELPDIEKVAASLHDKPVHVMLVSLDDPSAYPDQIKRFVHDHHLQSPVYWLNVSNPNAINEVLGGQWMGVVPTTLVINASKGFRRLYQGKITADELRGAIAMALK